MPATELNYYMESDGGVPVRDWLWDLRARNPRAFAKCAAKIVRLAALGYELRRPDADLLRDGIYELRAREGRVNYRILYFFHGRNIAFLAHALTKEDKVPAGDIERALQRRQALIRNPDAHTATVEDDHA